MPPIEIHLEHFTGPMDLLLYLVRQDEMDIFDLDLAHITEQFLRVIEQEGVRDLPGAYHFLAMAATLVELKSRLLLPQAPKEEGEEPEEELDPRLELAQQLAAYQGIKDITEELSQRYEQTGRHWPRHVVEQLEAEIVYSLDGLSVYDLMTTFSEVMERPRFKQITIFKEDYDLDDARSWVRARIRQGPHQLRSLLLEQHDVISLIITFVAILDLIKEEELSFERGERGEIQLAASSPGNVM